jgi:CHC2-type zinc finger protein
VSRHISLRRVGNEFVGLCPFHQEKTASFSISEEKGLFHCFGCGESGDVIDFVRKHDRITFAEAAKSLGIDFRRVPQGRKPDLIRQRAAVALASWLNDQHLKVGVLLRELSRKIALAEEKPDPELVESQNGQWARAKTFGGIVRPICFAAFRLITSSNFVGCSTGRSAGFASLRILSVLGTHGA